MTHCHVTCHMTWSISGSNAIPSRTHNSHDSCTCISMYTVWHDSCPDLFPAATQYHRTLTWLIIWPISVWHNSRQVTCCITWSISGSNSILSGTDIWLNCCTWWMSLPHSFPCELTHNLIYFRVTQLTPRDMPHHLIYFRQQLNAIGHWHMTWLLCVMYLMKIIYFWEQFYTANYEGYDMTDDLQRTATHCNSLQLIHTILHRQLQREWHDWQPPLF